MDTLIRTAFQPVMSARGQIVFYEGLLRFRDGHEKPDGRRSAIRRWEDSGYIATIDVAVLKQAAAALDLLHSSLLVSVNVSPVTLKTSRERYLKHLRNVGDYARRLIVEVTDSGLSGDPSVFLRFARDCAATGVRLALDDCIPGTPRCAETVLRTVRPKLLKLERKALSTAFQSLDDEAIKDLVALCDEIGTRVVAQGIDSQEKLDWASTLGVRYFQGFLVGHPRQFPLLESKDAFVDLQLSQVPAELCAA